MATAVQIELRVDETGAVTGLRAFDSEIKRTTNNIRVMGEEGNRAGKKVRGGMQDADKAVLTTKDNAKLLTQEFGIHMPKAMLKVIAHNELLAKGLNAVSTGLIALGAVGIFLNLAHEAYQLYGELLDVNKAINEYQEKARQSAREKLFDSASIETTKTLLTQINDEIDALQKKRDRFEAAGGYSQYVPGGANLQHGPIYPTLQPPAFSVDDSKRQAELMAQRDKLRDHQSHLEQADAQQKIKSESQYQETIATGYGKITAKEKGLRAEIESRYQIQRANEDELLRRANVGKKPGDADYLKLGSLQKSFDEERAKATAEAERQIQAERIVFARETTNTIRRLENDAVNAGLRGELLALAQRQQAYEEFVRQYGANTRARKAIDDRYFADLTKRVDDYEQDVAKMQRDAAAAGQTGIAAIQSRGEARIADANEVYRKKGFEGADLSNLTSYGRAKFEEEKSRAQVIRDRAIATAQQQTLQEMQREQETFHKQIDDLSEQSTMRQVSGFAKIYAEGDKALRDLQRRFDETYGKMRLDNPEAVKVFQQGQADLARAKSGVAADTNSQVQDLAQKNANETLRIETEAQQKVLALHHDQTSALYSEYNARVAAYEEMLRKQEISQDDYNRRVAAAGRELNTELAQQAKETRDKLAGELEQFFDNPQQFFQRAAKRAMAESAATILLQLRGKIAGQGPTTGHGSGDRPWPELGGNGLPDLFGGIFGRRKTASGVPLPGQDQRPGTPGVQPTGKGVFSIAAATITIGSANLLNGPGALASTAAGPLLNVPSNGQIPGVPSSFTSLASPSGNATIGSDSTSGGLFSPNASGGGSGITGGIQTAQELYGDAKQLGSDFGLDKKAGSLGKFFGGSGASSSGNVTQSGFPGIDLGESSTTAKTGSMLGGGGFKANAGGALSGGLGLFGAYQGSGGFSGALGGAMSGAQLGMSVAGPWGAAIGAVGGAILGAFGFGARAKAEKYDKQQVRPHISEEERSFGAGTIDYLSAFSDMNSLDEEAKKTTNQWGHGAQSYYQDTIKPEIAQAKVRFTREAKAGRAQFGISAAQFHTGDEVNHFGNMNTSPTEGFIHAQIGEFIVKPNVAARNKGALQAMNAGMSIEQIAAAYRSTMRSESGKRSQTVANRSIEMSVYAMDSRDVHRFFNQHKHTMRAALNDSDGEYSGGADA
jgi:hypothetical protein